MRCEVNATSNPAEPPTRERFDTAAAVGAARRAAFSWRARGGRATRTPPAGAGVVRVAGSPAPRGPPPSAGAGPSATADGAPGRTRGSRALRRPPDLAGRRFGRVAGGRVRPPATGPVGERAARRVADVGLPERRGETHGRPVNRASRLLRRGPWPWAQVRAFRCGSSNSRSSATDIVSLRREKKEESDAMADVSVPAAATAEASAAPKKSKSTKVARAKAAHPPTAVMVSGAIKSLKERGGSSLQAIKKYISSTYKIDAEKLAPFIKKFIKASVASGVLVQTKGKGASGSFKLAAGAAGAKKSASAAEDKKVKKPASKSAARAKKDDAAAAKKAPAKKSAGKTRTSAAAVKPKPKASPKAKKTAKAPTKKPKSPKPKTTKATKLKPAAAKRGRKASPRKK